MKRKILKVGGVFMALSLILCTPAFAIEESDVETAIAASSNEAVAGNIFLWFLCAVAFLKISQKIDSFLAGLGVNVGRTGGSMLSELLIAGRAIGTAASGLSGAAGNIFNRSHASSQNTAKQAAGQAFVGSGGGLVGVAKRAAGNAAAGSATGTGSGLGSFIGGAMFGSSMASGGKFANEVVGAVATGDIASVGSIKGEQAAQALSNYLGYGSAASAVGDSTGAPDGGGAVPATPVGEVAATAVVGDEIVSSDGERDQVTITPDGGAAGGAAVPGRSPNLVPPAPKVGLEVAEKSHEPVPGATPAPATEGAPIPSQSPAFRDVEIGGGRITGYETPAGGGEERQFAMYNASQYMVPSGPYEVVQTVDGESWYKQYAQPTVQKTPYEDASGKIIYNEKIVEQMPQIPKRKDRV